MCLEQNFVADQDLQAKPMLIATGEGSSQLVPLVGPSASLHCAACICLCIKTVFLSCC